ncbi:MAG: AbrB family transcriptional regulator [Rhodospirillaceae bacterium]|nr:AbrB family transcriptional regulator [Rhodospirillaceae bacterium]
MTGRSVEGPAAAAALPRRTWVFRLSITFLVGAAGGWLFDQANLPLAWMIGALVFTTVGAIAGVPMIASHKVRQPLIAIIGVMLGAQFTPEVAARIPEWWASVIALLAYVGLSTSLLFWYFRRLGHGPVTAYCASTPGGLNEMVLIAQEMRGDYLSVALVHATRVLVTVLIVPFGFIALGLYDQGSRASLGAAFGDIPLDEAAILTAGGVAGYFGAKALKIPAAALTGPMIVSALLHLLGASTIAPPGPLVAIAQVVVGSTLGARFAGVPIRRVLRLVVHSLGSTAIMISLTILLAAAASAFVDASIPALVLALAPGGLAEMSLIALALGIEAAFVAAHHVIRIALVVLVLPTVFRRRFEDPGGRGEP